MSRFLSVKQVCELVGLSRTQITDKDDDGNPRAGMEDFPDPIYIGFRRLYDEEEVLAWQQRRRDDRGTTPKRERKSNGKCTDPFEGQCFS